MGDLSLDLKLVIMETTGERRYIRELMNELVFLFPRAGFTARVEELIEFCENNADEGWEWEAKYLPPDKPLRVLLQLLRKIERSGRYKQTWGDYAEPYTPQLHLQLNRPEDKGNYEMMNVIGGWFDIFAQLEDYIPISSGFDDYRAISGGRFTIFSKIVQMLKPHYAFIRNGDSLEGMSIYITDTPPEKQHTLYFAHFREIPWAFYARTMLFGPQLVKEHGLDKLLSAPAYQVTELPGPSVLIQGPGGFFDNRPLDVKPKDSWRDERDILDEYDAELAGYLGLSLDLS